MLLHMPKKLIKKSFELSIFGRPSRKVLWLLFKITRRIAMFSEHWLINHPFNRRLDREKNKEFHGADLGFQAYYNHIRNSISELAIQPKISIIVPVYKVDLSFFYECLRSVEVQTYENWELCIVDDCSEDPNITSMIERFRDKHPHKVKCSTNPQNLHISLTSNAALALATGDYIGLLDHDDRLLPNALGEMVRAINLNNSPDILYSDECHIDSKGVQESTYHKPSWSPLMHLSVHYTTHFSVFKTALVNKVGGFRQGFEGSQDHDLMLRLTEASEKPVVHVPMCLYQWRAHEGSTARDVKAKPYAAIAGEKAVREACARRGWPALVEFEPNTLHYRVKFQIKKPHELVSIIIPSKNSIDLIRPCVESIVSKSQYNNFEIIIVDHASDCEKVSGFYKEMKDKLGEKFRTVIYDGYFNFARMNNLGAKAAKGQYLLLLNNDTEVITEDWLEEMLRLAQLPEVGAVGPKLLFPDGKIQHAGLVGFGYHIAGHAGYMLKEDSGIYCQHLQTTHEVIGVTGACIMIKKSKYWKVGGLEEILLPNGFGDVDFCLKLRESGYSNVYVPYAKLFHKESPTRKKSFEFFERNYLINKWGKELLTDPYMNPCFIKDPYYKEHVYYSTQQPSSIYFDCLLNKERSEN